MEGLKSSQIMASEVFGQFKQEMLALIEKERLTLHEKKPKLGPRHADFEGP